MNPQNVGIGRSVQLCTTCAARVALLVLLAGAIALALVVPLLTVPQGTHYVLDGLIWRRGDTRTRPSQRAALGFLPCLWPISKMRCA